MNSDLIKSKVFAGDKAVFVKIIVKTDLIVIASNNG